MNRRLFLGHVLAAVGAIASVPLLTKLLPAPEPVLFRKDAFALAMEPLLCRCGKPISEHRQFTDRELLKHYIKAASENLRDDIDRRAFEYAMSQVPH